MLENPSHLDPPLIVILTLILAAGDILVQWTTLNSSTSEYKFFVQIKRSADLSEGQNLSELTHATSSLM